MTKKDAKPCLIRWVLLLQEYDFKVKIEKGMNIKLSITCLDKRMKVCENWVKRLKLMMHSQINMYCPRI